MKSIYKYLIINLCEKKVRSFLILLSIGVSAALLFATMGMSNTCKQMYVDQIVKWSGTSDITIEVNKQQGSDTFIKNTDISLDEEKYEYNVGIIKSEGLYNPNVENMQYLDIVGTTLEELALYNNYLLEEGDIEDFSGNKIMISSTFAEKAGLSIGDEIPIKFSQDTITFTVKGIAKQKGLFINESTSVVAVVPRDALEALYGSEGISNQFYLKLKDNSNMDTDITSLKESLTNCTVSRSVNPSDLSQAVNTVVMPFRISSLSVVFMSIYIVYTSFHLMVLERMSAIGTFRSIGLTKKKLKRIFVLESFLWGVVGGILGCLLGYIALNTVIIKYVEKLSEGTLLTVAIQPIQIVISMALAIILTMLSALPPMFKALKKSTKNIILNISEEKVKKRKLQSVVLLIMVLFFIACVVIPHTMGASLACMIITIVCMTIILILMIAIIPYGIQFIAACIMKFGRSDKVLWIAARNISTNKNMKNIIRLLAISASSILIITNISNAISNTIANVYDTYHLYDISMSYRTADESFEEQLGNVEGVESYVSDYEIDSVKLEDQNYYLNTLYGIKDETFFDFMGAEQTDESQNAIEELNTGRNIVITNLLASKLGLSVGDEVKLTIDDSTFDYTITGMLESSFKLGNIGFVSGDYLQKDINLSYYTTTYIKTNSDVDTVKNNIKAEFLEDILFIQTLDELVAINQDLIVSIFRIINAYAMLAVIIGIIGIANNILACYIERRRELAMYRSIGMSKKRMKNLFISEAILCGTLGILVAFIGTTGILNITPFMLSYIFGNVAMEYNVILYAGFAIAGIFIMCLLTILPIAKADKLSIIESIKYE
ncbi:FtsX-like permease family protein [Lachnotalea glycerini]|nr:FtsX-like permease family protein [Lachnotalea glycerini]